MNVNEKIVMVISEDDFNNKFSDKYKKIMINSSVTRVMFARNANDPESMISKRRCIQDLENTKSALIIFVRAQHHVQILSSYLIRSRVSSIVFGYEGSTNSLLLYTGAYDFLYGTKCEEHEDYKGNNMIVNPAGYSVVVGDANLIKIARTIL